MRAGAVDGVTCGFALRNLVDLARSSTSWPGSLRPGGRIALLEVATPPNPVLRWGHGVYFGRVVPLIGRALSDPAAYRYLPRSVAYLPPPDEMLAMIAPGRLRRRRAPPAVRAASPSSSPATRRP